MTLFRSLGLLVFAFCHAIANGQGCLPDGITLSTQAEVNAFLTDHPNCTEIEGDLDIGIFDGGGESDITDLSALSNLQKVDGNVRIAWNPDLTSLQGLNNLEDIGGHLNIFSCAELTSMSGLDSLNSVGDFLQFQNLSQLTSVSGLGNLTYVGSDFQIRVSQLTNFEGLGSLEIIDGDLYLETNDLTSFTGLNSLAYIGGNLDLINNLALASFSGLDQLEHLGGNLEIDEDLPISNFIGLGSLMNIGGNLTVIDNSTLIDFSGLSGLQTVGSYLYISGNQSLENLNGLEQLSSIGGFIRVDENNSLQSLSGILNIDPASIKSQTMTISDIQINNNGVLTTCAVKSICGALALPETTTLIENNASGCSSASEIEDACESISVTPRFVNPVEGEYMQDFIIVNYVDWEVDGILDHECGSKTYDGHQGTDFVLKSFPQMDAGVAVLAVDSGVVIAAHDGEFDRETEGDPVKGLGNFIGLSHTDKLYTYYGHLKLNSLLVEVGDTVAPGQKIGEIASSGNSTDPHLHFELWYDSTTLIDPFAGTCGNADTYWLNPYPYNDDFSVWESGLTNIKPTTNDLRERPEEKSDFEVGIDTAITYWSLQYGLLSGDVSRVEWYTPEDELWSSWEITHDRDWWYYYFWSFIDMPPAAADELWTVRYLVNGEVRDERTFTVSPSVSTQFLADYEHSLYYSDNRLFVESESPYSDETYLELRDIQGRLISTFELAGQMNASFTIDNRHQGIYIASIVAQGAPLKTIKFVAH